MLFSLEWIFAVLVQYVTESSATQFAIGYSYNGGIYVIFLHSFEMVDFLKTIIRGGLNDFVVKVEDSARFKVSIRWKPHSKTKLMLWNKYRGIKVCSLAEFEKRYADEGWPNRGKLFEQIIAEYFSKYDTYIRNTSVSHKRCADLRITAENGEKLSELECKYIGCNIASNVFAVKP